MRERETRKLTFWILVLIGVLYFCAMIPFNLTGAETPEMLEVFEVDEYAQYPHVIRMLTPGEGIYQTIRNFFIYLHYFYGYPFYFWSALSILPLKLSGTVWPGNTRVIVCVLRQMLSVLPMILSAGLLTRVITKFRSIIPSVVLYVLLLTMPAVVQNDLWWHPDSLSLLFLSLTFYFLDKDGLRCGKYFLFAAAACGAAVGTKYLGLYFALAIPAYLVCCLIRKTVSFRQMFLKAMLFLLVMAAFILISDPLLLLPQERAEIIAVMKQQTELSGTGIFLRYDVSFLENGRLPGWMTENYLRLPWLVLAVLALVSGLFIRDPQVQTLSVVFLAYLLTACTVNFNTAASRLHYYLPILLPLAAQFPVLTAFFPERLRKQASIVLCLVLALQIGINVRKDVPLLADHLHREEASGSIALYKTLESEYLPLPEVPAERMTRVFRDWKAYFPEQEGYAVETDWELGSLAFLEEWHPDLILLEKENIRAYSSETVLDNAVNTDRMRDAVEFYSAAAAKKLPGYEFLFENDFGVVFRKDLP